MNRTSAGGNINNNISARIKNNSNNIEHSFTVKEPSPAHKNNIFAHH